MIAPHDFTMYDRPIHAVDFTFVSTDREDCTAIIGNTAFIDIMPDDNCMLANIDYCAGRSVSITFDDRIASQKFRARALWQRLTAMEYKPTIITANTPTDTYMLFVEANRLAKGHIFEEKTP
jgi:hypothetical protein